MFNYKVKVATGDEITAGTVNDIYIVLVGDRGETPKYKLDNWGRDFLPGAVDKYSVSTNEDVGEILCVRLYKEYYLVSDDWFCKYVTVISPGGYTYHFPYYQWLLGTTTLEIPEGKGKILTGSYNPLIAQLRRNDLEDKREKYRWRCYADGMPHCVEAENMSDLQLKDQYSYHKSAQFYTSGGSTTLEMMLRGFHHDSKSWRTFDDIMKVSYFFSTKTADIVAQKWKEDTFFGYQFLNGVHPVQIRKCFQIPDNFPVGDEMVASSLGTFTSLREELQKGNVFFTDYKILEGLQTNTIDGQKQYLAAPLCLLWKNPQNNIVPIAIQLGQTPGKDTPIFLPSDSEWDWTLAKLWVRNAEFQVHGVISHLLHTHLFAEVFYIATVRQLPMAHPLYKLLIPHFRFTLVINILGRQKLIGPGGIFDEVSSIGRKAVNTLAKRAMEELTYDSLCFNKDIKRRAVESIPNYYYREDGMKIWLVTERFVSDIVRYYYADDDAVSQDPELQAWVEEIYREGFLENQNSGIPSSLKTQANLIQYLTMVIFTCSAKHAAVNNSQFDFGSWMPNTPPSMRKPPPTVKGTATSRSVLDTLPQINTTSRIIVACRLLGNDPVDMRILGNYPEEYFTEDSPKKFIQVFQRELAGISSQIKERNKNKYLTYPYLDPQTMENSISI